MQDFHNIFSIRNIFEKDIKKGDKILAAVSGGQDSMCLLHMLYRVKELMGFELACLTIDHNIRGEDSQNDAQLVEDFCKACGIEFYRENVYPLESMGTKGFNLEQEARNLRYECFYRIAEHAAANKVATAHHAFDNAECVLLNLLRGTGTSGLASMHKGREKIIRPLLTLDRDEIENYVKINGVPFAFDVTNFDGDYSRNYIRMEILPRLCDRFNGAVKNISALSERAAIDETFIDSFAEVELCAEGVRISLALLNSPAVGVRALKKALKFLGVEKDVTAINYSDCISLKDKASGKVILLKYGVEAVRERENILLKKGNI